jgi:nicotinate dehydrogenase subunit B
VTAPETLSLDALFALPDSLIVFAREADGRDLPYLLIDGAGQVFGFNGHVDLGTGIRTSLAQIVAEELDADPAMVRMVLGDTARTPNQGATIASDTIQTTAVPLRAAAAQARAALLSRVAGLWQVDPADLVIAGGTISDGTRRATFAEALAGMQVRLPLQRDRGQGGGRLSPGRAPRPARGHSGKGDRRPDVRA